MNIRNHIQRAGGLASATDLSKHWKISKARVSVLAKQNGFPEPVGTVGGRPVWLASEAREWRDKQTQKRSSK